ncbi:MAG: 16S rRNA (guanine(527)-N(7))-methyltransferase RsmG [Candidatus Eremiobacteraeota bacterium]|nr:16S rRNA (guanine(527)-N(7))-methyltransferase RsmG [Candidatus Eremiobacteraeota bacterium]
MLGFAEREQLAPRLLEFGELLVRSNRETNLVGAKEVGELIGPHFLDSLAPLCKVTLRQPVVDVGSGAGFPGLVGALAFPQVQFVLLEGRAKRSEFLRRAVDALDLTNVDVLKLRAETAGRSGWRGQAGTVLVRAVAKPTVAFELGLPLLTTGGELVLYVGRKGEPDFVELAVMNLLGGALKNAARIDVPALAAERHVWTVKKVGPTPDGLPRRSGTPARHPLSLADCST